MDNRVTNIDFKSNPACIWNQFLLFTSVSYHDSSQHVEFTRFIDTFVIQIFISAIIYWRTFSDVAPVLLSNTHFLLVVSSTHYLSAMTRPRFLSDQQKIQRIQVKRSSKLSCWTSSSYPSLSEGLIFTYCFALVS